MKMASPAEILRKPYARIVVPDEDGSFVAEIQEFPGCIAVGDTAAEALSNLHEVAESWLETTLARGQSIPQPIEDPEFSGKLVLRLSRSLHERAARAAKRDGVSLNQYIGTALAVYVGGSDAIRPAGATVNVTNVSAQFTGPTAVLWAGAVTAPSLAGLGVEWNDYNFGAHAMVATNPWAKETGHG
jgi:predicted RNase H-like HicB family nuclease